MCLRRSGVWKISAGGITIEKNSERCQQFKQNLLFQTNQKLFCETVDGEKREETELPDPTEAATFWGKIWLEEVSHNWQGSWLEKVGQEVQEDIVTVENITTGVNEMASWKEALI